MFDVNDDPATSPDFEAGITRLKQEISEIKTRLRQKEQKERKMFDYYNRPRLSQLTDGPDLHQKAMDRYLRHGDEGDLRHLASESKAIHSQVNAEGGFLLDTTTSDRIQDVLEHQTSLRALANIVSVESSSFEVLADYGQMGAGWTNDAPEPGPFSQSVRETTTPQFDRISIQLHELFAMPKVSQKLLDDAAFDLETWLAKRIAEKFATTESDSFIKGDGVYKPRGILDHEMVDNASWEWGKIGVLKTGVDGDFAASNAADAIVDLVYALGAHYRRKASFIMNSKTAGAVRKMRDADGRFLWSDSLVQGELARLMGYPVLICEDMPDIAPESKAIAFGDFSAGYTIAERPGIRVLRDPFSAKPHVLFYAYKRVGGDVSDFSAIKLLDFSA